MINQAVKSAEKVTNWKSVVLMDVSPNTVWDWNGPMQQQMLKIFFSMLAQNGIKVLPRIYEVPKSFNSHGNESSSSDNDPIAFNKSELTTFTAKVREIDRHKSYIFKKLRQAFVLEKKDAKKKDAKETQSLIETFNDPKVVDYYRSGKADDSGKSDIFYSSLSLGPWIEAAKAVYPSAVHVTAIHRQECYRSQVEHLKGSFICSDFQGCLGADNSYESDDYKFMFDLIEQEVQAGRLTVDKVIKSINSLDNVSLETKNFFIAELDRRNIKDESKKLKIAASFFTAVPTVAGAATLLTTGQTSLAVGGFTAATTTAVNVSLACATFVAGASALALFNLAATYYLLKHDYKKTAAVVGVTNTAGVAMVVYGAMTASNIWNPVGWCLLAAAAAVALVATIFIWSNKSLKKPQAASTENNSHAEYKRLR